LFGARVKSSPQRLRPVESCVSKVPVPSDRNPDNGFHHAGIGKANGTGRKAVVGLRPSFSAHVRWCERRAPVQICEDREGLEGRPVVSHIHISRNYERDVGHPAAVAGIEFKSLLHATSGCQSLVVRPELELCRKCRCSTGPTWAPALPTTLEFRRSGQDARSRACRSETPKSQSRLVWRINYAHLPTKNHIFWMELGIGVALYK
jgi:hypothetical protein